MHRVYKTAAQWKTEVPNVRLYILMSPEGRMINLHCSLPEPEGKYCLIGVID